MWTMEQLVERAHAALAAEYPGAPNGRVRDLPDRRSIRWYSTIGLVDRPLGTRGRTALYGPRHLMQLVAIKRRQASGQTLAEIQAELAGASDETLAAASRVPDGLLTTDEPAAEDAARPPFWKHAPAAGDTSAAGETGADAGSPVLRTALPSIDWQKAPPGFASFDHDITPAAHQASDEPLITGFPLGGGVILLVPDPPAGLGRDEIAAAARPLLELLASRGLTNGRNE
ncbi:MerR-like DNA binding protein [Actinoplanes lutulentus]|uniref:MerR-like DNA binding protein n=2 Tax=Actinoplanes lutulentus TaxID=1287878 RepID=A0A327YZX6_9ACTN|nr:MerR-like DNA binding protein [Actinoplanes lutulentus]